MNSTLNTRIARSAAALVASLLITFTGLELIANYALPAPAQASAVMLADARTAPQR